MNRRNLLKIIINFLAAIPFVPFKNYGKVDDPLIITVGYDKLTEVDYSSLTILDEHGVILDTIIFDDPLSELQTENIKDEII